MITTRPYRPEDRATCKQVYFRAVREGTAAVYSEEMRADWAKSPEVDETIPDKLLDQAAWVSMEDGRITGFMSLTPEGHLDMAFVLPEVMGKGHAAALYDVLLAHAKAQGLTRLTVDASEFSCRFLSRRRWRLDRVETHVSDGGVSYDLNHMSLDLGPEG